MTADFLCILALILAAWRIRHSFQLGAPVLVMLVIGLSALLLVVRQSARSKPDLTLWVFAGPHAEIYRSIVPEYAQRSGKSIDVQLVGDAINIRLTSLFMSDLRGSALPDAAEIEISHLGEFFRPPVQDVGFLPLNHYLETTGLRRIDHLTDPGQAGWNARLTSDDEIYTYRDGRWTLNPDRTRPDAWIDRIVPARLAAWSKQGTIFGVPHDVHPVSMTYRDDLFRAAGIDLSTATTWPEFKERCLQFQKYWQSRGYPHRHALELPAASADYLVVMLQQRHLDLVDEAGGVHLSDPRVAETVAFYVQMVAGPGAIGAAFENTTGVWTNDLEQGNICATWTPDWKLNFIRMYGDRANLAGNLRMMPLPRFEPEDAPTATWGGTMIGIPRNAPHPDDAWKLIEFLYFSPKGLTATQKESHILPALMEQWSDPFYQQPDPFFGGQKVDALYISLARQIPPRVMTPITGVAQIELSVVMSEAVDYLTQHGTAGLDDEIRRNLARCDEDLKRRIQHVRFD